MIIFGKTKQYSIFNFRQETISELLTHMLEGEKNESVIVNGLSVIQTLLEFKKMG